MSATLTLEDLSRQVTSWCEDNEISPASGQAGESVSERNIRYYRTLGLVDAPVAGAYGEKHLLQLIAIRLLQARGLPLRRIRELLYGRSLADLREIRRRGLDEAESARAAARVAVPAVDELWRMIPLNEDFMLVSRRGTPLTPHQRAAVLRALGAGTSTQSAQSSKRP